MVKIIVWLLILSSCARYEFYQEIRYELLGTFAEIKVWGDNRENLKLAVDESFKEIKRIHHLFSIYDKNSPVYKLNLTGRARLPEEVINLIKESIKYSELTNGAFDITVYPLVKLWKEAKRKGKMPTDEEVKSLLKKIGYQKIKIAKDRTVSLEKGMGIDFGGIATGYAVDSVVNILKKRKVKSALINIGGDIYAFGKELRIGVRHPRGKLNDVFTILKIKDKAIVTSGDYERYFIINNKRIHNILDPRTGYPADKSISVTVICDTTLMADALSTGIFVLGPEEGMKLIQRLNIDGIIVNKNGEIYISKNLKKYNIPSTLP